MEEDSPRPCSPDDLGPPGTDDASSINLKHVLIKWTGSKRRQAKQIVAKFPRQIATYYEPFLGGGSVLYELLGTDIEVGRFECSDTCEPLIALWQVVKDDPNGLVEEYVKNWRLLQVSGAAYYREARQAFNESHDPHLFFFLLRTCRNGLVRFNRDGEFNSGFHGARPGMAPETVRLIVEDWGRRLSSKDVRFSVRDYRQITTQEGDLLYLDPPYDAREGYYYSGKFDFGELFGWLRKQQGDHLLSLNGFLGDDDRRLEVPADLYDRHRLLDNGNNPFDRLDGRDASTGHGEPLYQAARCSSKSQRGCSPPGTRSSNSQSEQQVRRDSVLTGGGTGSVRSRGRAATDRTGHRGGHQPRAGGKAQRPEGESVGVEMA